MSNPPPPPPGNPYGGQEPNPYAPYQGGYGYGYSYTPPKPTNGLAIGSLVTSVVGAIGLCFYGAGGVVGLVGAILGHVAMRQIKANDQAGRGLALAGVIVGWIAFAIGVVVIAAIIIFVVVAVNDASDCYTNSDGYYTCS